MFPRLSEPMHIGNMVIKNRFAMAPMGDTFCTKEGIVTERTLAYYGARAAGGVGLITMGNAIVDFPRGLNIPGRLVIDNDGTIPGLSSLAQEIKRHGAKAAIQLSHVGRLAKFKYTGFQPVAPSPIPYPAGGADPQGEVPREVTVEEIAEIVGLFAKAATRARKAGFEGVEIHAAHGYLLAEFLSFFSNKRKDQYGGSLENRARMLLEVLQAVRSAVGKDFPIWCRINGQEYESDNGFTLEDAKAVARMMGGLVDAVSVAAWGFGESALVQIPTTPGALLPLAAEIKGVVRVPVIAVGRISPDMGEQAIADSMADVIAIGRGLIADPEMPSKALSGRVENIRPCIACFYCQDRSKFEGKSGLSCAVNAAVGRELEYAIKPAKKVKKIAVLGGGPAGMEVARVLALRGHKVVLMEKKTRLGGQLHLATACPHKTETLAPLIDYFVNQLGKLGVEVKLNTEATLERIVRLKVDEVIIATGSLPVIPQVPGVDLAHVVTAADVLAGRAEAGKEVVVIGGGSTGCETAEFLCEKGRHVTVLEMLPEVGADMGFRDRMRLMSRLAKLPIRFLTKAKCQEINKDGVTVVTGEGEERFISAETVVLAVGVEPDNRLYLRLRASGFTTHLAGDCWNGRTITDAIADGFRLGCSL